VFNIFKKNPVEKLEKEYALKLKEAADAQRSGDIGLYSELTQQAESIINRIDKLKEDLET